jgi:hypothetical protein
MTVTTSIGAPPTSLVYGHTTLNAPYLVRTAKLSRVRPCQYYGGGPRGNPRCCRLSFAMLFAPFGLCVSHHQGQRREVAMGPLGQAIACQTIIGHVIGMPNNYRPRDWLAGLCGQARGAGYATCYYSSPYISRSCAPPNGRLCMWGEKQN